MNNENKISSYINNNNVFIISLLFSIIVYSIYLAFRGFGWDGDSIISGSQFIKIINRNLYYSPIDGGAHPKILTVLLFGTVYQITGSFYILTFLSIILNSIMVATIIKWIHKERGIWLISIFGLLINIPWAKIVINSDNTAFSIPFIAIGLYYISKNKYVLGTTLFVISNFFRTGSEFIIFILLINDFFKGRYNKIFILFQSSWNCSLCFAYSGRYSSNIRIPYA